MADIPDTLDTGALVDPLCDEFERGWLDDRPGRIEDFLPRVPTAARPALLRDLLAVEREYRGKAGRPVTPDEARDRFAALGPWAEAVIRQVLTPAAADVPTGPPGPLTEALKPPAEPLPEAVGGYRVVRELGRGGMGVVYLVDDPLGRRELAVKVMRREYAARPAARERFLREARAAGAVEHDHVVPVFQVGVDGDTPYLVMPRLRGESLDERLKRDPLPPTELVLKVGREVALGLAAAHAAGLVHRDVKPANAWLEGDPASPDPAARVRRVKVLDFGLALPAEGLSPLTATGLVGGTPEYMAPEQARGEEVDARADLFGLGAVLYRMAAGRKAFTGPTLSAVLVAVATHHPPPPAQVNPAVPPALSALILRLLEKDRGRRPGSAAEVADALAAIGAAGPAPPPPRARRRVWAAGAAVLAGGVLAALVAFGWPGTRDRTPAGGPPDPAAPAAEPLRVKDLRVDHFARRPDGLAIPVGVLGKVSFRAVEKDQVTVEAVLSRPGYAYLIACRPDGVVELCFPADEGRPPPLTDRPRYPTEDDRGVRYGLTDGAGLYVFAVVASDAPLPAWRDRAAGVARAWRPESAPGGVVWLDDGAWVEAVGPAGAARGDRGKGATVPGQAAVVRVTDGLKGFGAAAAVGFAVEPAGPG
ncbi:MAG: hypothetical protein C0501_29060 [Isosphaera sp.]|nr:hypothetical protein [Isosphaera sp.]